MTRITIQDLTKSLGATTVIRTLSVSLTQGITLLIGANGSGKTTLLRLLSGLLLPDTGTIRYASGLSPRESFGAIGYLGHNSALYPQLTVEENFKLYLALSETRADDGSLERWGLGQRTHQMVSELSRGLTVRCALARLFSKQHECILLDEPTNALDETGCGVLLEQLSKTAKTGTTVLIASHDVTRLAPLASRVLVLSEGRLVQDSAAGGVECALETYRRINR